MFDQRDAGPRREWLGPCLMQFGTFGVMKLKFDVKCFCFLIQMRSSGFAILWKVNSLPTQRSLQPSHSFDFKNGTQFLGQVGCLHFRFIIHHRRFRAVSDTSPLYGSASKAF